MTESATLKRAAVAAILFASLPPLGQPLESGTFCGIVTAKDGTHHGVVLLDDKPVKRLTWKAAQDWAASVGGQLPTRPVSAQLYANSKARFGATWYWTGDSLEADTGDEDDASFAWSCDFFGGTQSYRHKSAGGAAVAVRLIPLTA